MRTTIPSIISSMDLSSLLDAQPDALVIINVAGQIVYVNAQTVALFGYTCEELLGENIEKLLPSRYQAKHIGYRQKYFSNPHIRHMGVGLDLYGAKKTGDEFPVQVSLSPLKSGDNTLAFAAIRDVTVIKAERTRFESILQREKDYEKLRADQAEAYRHRQEEIVDTLCHELRNPLQGIYGNASLLEQNCQSLITLCEPFIATGLNSILLQQIVRQLNQMQESVRAIETCADHQKIIADDVLNFSKLEAHCVELNVVTFYPKTIIDNVLKMLRTVINDKKLQLIVEVPDQNIAAKGDPDRIAQILMNLMTNAIKFTPSGGVITVSFNYISNPNDSVVKLQFSVQDTGVGMTPDEKSRIFNRFAQGNRKTYQQYGGSGLGLMISKGLVELMKGEFDIVSRKDVGSTFSFYVECTRCHQLELQESEFKSNDQSMISPPIEKPLSGQIVLVVDDNTINQKIVVRQLEREGALCFRANNGEEAIQVWKQHHEITCILMDIEMPIMGGLETTSLIRQEEKETGRKPSPIIGLSGNARDVYAINALTNGMNDYVTKPYKIVQLVEKILHFSKLLPPPNPMGKNSEEKSTVNDNATLKMTITPPDTFSNLPTNTSRSWMRFGFASPSSSSTCSQNTTTRDALLSKEEVGTQEYNSSTSIDTFGVPQPTEASDQASQILQQQRRDDYTPSPRYSSQSL